MWWSKIHLRGQGVESIDSFVGVPFSSHSGCYSHHCTRTLQCPFVCCLNCKGAVCVRVCVWVRKRQQDKCVAVSTKNPFDPKQTSQFPFLFSSSLLLPLAKYCERSTFYISLQISNRRIDKWVQWVNGQRWIGWWRGLSKAEIHE